VADLGDELVVYDPAGGGLHYLNPSAAIVFQLLDGTATLKQTAAEIADELDLPVEDVDRQVRATTKMLRKQGLLAERATTVTEEPPAQPAADEREKIRLEVPRSD
jgi:PqqD family protein of HPr-rel-A system